MRRNVTNGTKTKFVSKWTKFFFKNSDKGFKKWPFDCFLWRNIDLIQLVSYFLAVNDPNSYNLVSYRMEEIRQYYKFRPDELFRRITVTSLVTLMLEVSKLEYQEEDSEKLANQIREDQESLQKMNLKGNKLDSRNHWKVKSLGTLNFGHLDSALARKYHNIKRKVYDHEHEESRLKFELKGGKIANSWTQLQDCKVLRLIRNIF